MTLLMIRVKQAWPAMNAASTAPLSSEDDIVCPCDKVEGLTNCVLASPKIYKLLASETTSSSTNISPPHHILHFFDYTYDSSSPAMSLASYPSHHHSK